MEGRHDAELVARAWDEIYIAEGSDWFWWYGDDHSSAQDALFDYLFRKHLQNIYTLLGDEPPPDTVKTRSKIAAVTRAPGVAGVGACELNGSSSRRKR